jgi:PAS domain S-box-containing protein
MKESTSVKRAIEGLKLHEHICVFYDTRKKWLAAVIPFLRAGLKKGEKFLYIADPHATEKARKYLNRETHALRSAQKSAQVVIPNKVEAGAKQGSFDHTGMMDLLSSEAEKAHSEGYPAIRIVVELVGGKRNGLDLGRLSDSVSRLSRDFFAKYPCLAIFLYDRRLLSPGLVTSVMVTHMLAIRGTQTYNNILPMLEEELSKGHFVSRPIELSLDIFKRGKRTKKSIQFLSEVIDRSSQPIAFSYTDGHLLANRAVFDLLGIEESEFGMVRGGEEYLPVEWVPAEIQAMKALHRTLKPVRYEKELLRKDGKKVAVEVLVELKEDDNGKPVYIGWATDITERKAHERALRESEERYRRIAEILKGEREHLEEIVQQRTRELQDAEQKYHTVADFTYDWEDWSNQDGSFVYVSPSCERISGFQSQEFIARPHLFREIIVPEDRDHWDRHCLEIRRELKLGEIQFRIRRRDGEVRWIDQVCQPMRDARGNIIGFRASNRDITERKLMRQQIEKNAQEWQTTFDSISDPIMVLDAELRILRMNAATKTFLGLSVDQILGAHCFELVHGTSICPPGCPVQNVLVSKRHEETEVYERGRGTWLHITADPLLDPSGKLIGVVHTMKDITLRKKTEADIQQLQEDLRHASRITAMGELTAALAHELNQPLTGILSNAQAVQRFLSHPNLDLAEVRECLSYIVEDTERARGVVSGLRSMFKREVVEFETLDMNDVIREVHPLIRSHALLNNVLFVDEYGPGILPVSGNRIQLQQVLLNLVFNAFEAMKDSDLKTLRIQTRTDGGQFVTVKVEDSGTGVAEQKKGDIFKPFITTKKEGMGMGLAISHSIVKAHNGRIWMEKNASPGTTFYFSLPVAGASSQ